MSYINCVGLLALHDRRLLLAFSKNKQAWYLPGGKMDAAESDIPALQREIREELNMDLAGEGMKWYCYNEAPAFGENGLIMRQNCYLYELPWQPKPGAEIEEIRYFSLEEYRKQPQQVIGVLMVFDKLRQDGLVD